MTSDENTRQSWTSARLASLDGSRVKALLLVAWNQPRNRESRADESAAEVGQLLGSSAESAARRRQPRTTTGSGTDPHQGSGKGPHERGAGRRRSVTPPGCSTTSPSRRHLFITAPRFRAAPCPSNCACTNGSPTRGPDMPSAGCLMKRPPAWARSRWNDPLGPRLVSGPTKSSSRWAEAGWARCIARRISGSIDRSRSRLWSTARRERRTARALRSRGPGGRASRPSECLPRLRRRARSRSRLPRHGVPRRRNAGEPHGPRAAPPSTTRSTSPARSPTALAHTHQHGLVHRDLKPGNVMLRPDGRQTARLRTRQVAVRHGPAGGMTVVDARRRRRHRRHAAVHGAGTDRRTSRSTSEATSLRSA